MTSSVAEELRRAGCVYAEDEARLIIESAAGSRAALSRLVDRRCRGEPIELVVGFADFAGVRVGVEAGVFVPRRRSESMVDIAADLLHSSAPGQVVVDLGCGSGGLMAALLSRAECVAYAVDNDPVAIRCARRNLEGTAATVLLGDYFTVLPDDLRGRVGLVLANLPYVPTAALGLLPREARLYEPAATLDGGFDGLVPLRRGLRAASGWLSPGASYLCELDASQLDAARRVAADRGYTVAAVTSAPETGVLVRLHLSAGSERARTRRARPMLGPQRDSVT